MKHKAVSTTILCLGALLTLSACSLKEGAIKDLVTSDPISTSFKDANSGDALPDDFGNNLEPKNLALMPRSPQGGYLLSEGLYEMTARSYCLKAGTHAPSRGDGYLFAPLKGKKEEIIRTILQNSEQHLDIQQKDIQLLIWAILAKTKYSDLSSQIKATAQALLSKKQISELNGGALGYVPEPLLKKVIASLPAELQKVIEIENQMRSLFSKGSSQYQEFERLAILTGEAVVDRPDIKRGRWSRHPDGYFVRYFPIGYSQTRVQVYVPGATGINNRQTVLDLPKLNGLGQPRAYAPSIASINNRHTVLGQSIAVEFDGTNDVAVPANTGAQRLAQSNVPINAVTATGEETIDDPCQRNGSAIGCENQSLGESIDIVGTSFALHYQSDRATGRNRVNPVAVTHAKTLGGWTLSSHHRYDPTANALYLGTGNRRDTAALSTVKASAGGGFLIASEDGGVVYEFASDGRHLKTLHGLTGEALYSFAYNAQGLLTDITDGDGNRTVIQRGTNGSPTAIVGPYGQTTGLAVDANGFLASITNPSGEMDKFTTSPNGLLTSYTNARNKTSKFTYDAKGRLLTETDATGAVQSLARTEAGSASTIKFSTGEARITQYQVTPNSAGGEARVITDATGLKVQRSRAADGAETVALPDGTKTTKTLASDPRFGRSAAVVDSSSITTPSGLKFAGAEARNATLADPANPFSLTKLTGTSTINGRAFTSAFDGASRTFVDSTPIGRKRQTTIDKFGRIVSEVTTGLLPVAYNYDSRGRIASVTQGSGADARALQFNYDSNGFLSRMTDPLGRTVSFARNGSGRVTQQTLPDGRNIGYGYDAGGNLTAVTPPGKPAHRFTFTDLDQVAAYTPPPIGNVATDTKYTYNRDRQLARVDHPGGQTVNFGYDTTGKLKQLRINQGTFDFGYEANTGQLKSITAPGGIDLAYIYDGSLQTGSTLSGTVTGSVQRVYDNDFRVTQLKVNNANAISFQFDQDGLLTNAGSLSLTRDSRNGLLTGTTLGNATDKFEYDGFAEVKTYTAKYNAGEIFKTQYSYDKLGRIIQKAETIGGVTSAFDYSYDTAGRLAGVKKNGAVTSSYTYDSNGNRLTAPNLSTTPVYDAQDRLTRYNDAIYAYTANGELKTKTVGASVTSYDYDVLGNLRAVTLPTGQKLEYLIDGNNRRIGKKVNGTLAQGLLYQDQLKPIAELDGSNNIISRFIYARRVNVPDYMRVRLF